MTKFLTMIFNILTLGMFSSKKKSIPVGGANIPFNDNLKIVGASSLKEYQTAQRAGASIKPVFAYRTAKPSKPIIKDGTEVTPEESVNKGIEKIYNALEETNLLSKQNEATTASNEKNTSGQIQSEAPLSDMTSQSEARWINRGRKLKDETEVTFEESVNKGIEKTLNTLKTETDFQQKAKKQESEVVKNKKKTTTVVKAAKGKPSKKKTTNRTSKQQAKKKISEAKKKGKTVKSIKKTNTKKVVEKPIKKKSKKVA